MTKVSSINKSYCDIYTKLWHFAPAPYSWGLDTSQGRDDYEDLFVLFLKLTWEMPIKLLLTPILLPATIVTFTLAAVSAILVALTHPLALLGAALADTITPTATPGVA